MAFRDWFSKYAQRYGPIFYSPGSWPNEEMRKLTDDELIALTEDDDKLREVDRVNMRQMLTAARDAGGTMAVIADGDPAMFSDWIRILCGRILRRRLGLKEHDGTRYRYYLLRRPRYGGKPGLYEKLKGDGKGLGYARRAKIAHEVLLEMRQEFNLPELKLLVGLPGPDSMGGLTGMYFGGDAFVRLMADEWNLMLETLPAEDVVYSIEEPIEQVLVAFARLLGLGGKLGRYYGRRFTQLVRHLPKARQEEVLAALHQCWGALHKATVVESILKGARVLPASLIRRIARFIQSTKAIANLSAGIYEAATEEVSRGSRLKLVIIQWPLAEGTMPPSHKSKGYRGLKGLRERFQDVVLVGGLAHHGQTDGEAAAARDAIVEAIGDVFGAYGPYCGQGRLSEANAVAEIRQAILLGWPNGQPDYRGRVI